MHAVIGLLSSRRYSPADTATWKRYIKYTPALVLALLSLISCGGPYPYIIPTLSKAPASHIRLSITISDQYTTASQVTIRVNFADNTGRPIALTGKQSLQCNGVVFPQLLYTYSIASTPRQPPGGAYTFTYTDEQGQSTSFAITVPLETPAITSPAAGATVPIPPSAYPYPTAISSPSSIHPALVTTNGLTIRYSLPALPQGGQTTVSGYAACGSSGQCGSVAGTEEPATGSYILDATTTFGQSFSVFIPGPGSIGLHLTFLLPPTGGGFAALAISLQDTLAEPIIWSAP